MHDFNTKFMGWIGASHFVIMHIAHLVIAVDASRYLGA
jgi:hypothetical protein